MIEREVLDVLSEMTCEGKVARMNSGQLPRPLYVAVNKVLDALGGKWNRKLGGHVFEYEPEDALSDVISSGEMPKKNPLAFFPTPPPVLEILLGIDLAFLNGGVENVLEPSAGDGAIVKGLRRILPPAVEIVAVELDPVNVDKLRGLNLPNVRVVAADFLEWSKTCGESFDMVAMNPPFSQPGQPLAWMQHIEAAYDLTDDGGILTAVCPGSWLPDTKRKALRRFRSLVEETGEHFHLLDGSFKESGTMVQNLTIVTLQKGQ